MGAKDQELSSPGVDIVITWVDGNDENWLSEKRKYSPRTNKGAENVRFRDWDNLRYWFRGVEKFAPWVRKIHFVTWGHLPPWLDTEHPKLNIVRHSGFIPEKYLPTFNSHTIELNMHRIPGLSKSFVYFNDDMFITSPTKERDFFIDKRPCDTYGLNCLYFINDSIAHINGCNVEQINMNFKSVKSVMKGNKGKWYSHKNGLRNNIKTFMLSSWNWFPGFHYDHLPTSYDREIFEEVWDKCYDALDRTCSCRFRQDLNVSPWLMKYWQLCKGLSIPRKQPGQAYHITDENFSALCTDIRSGRHKLICVNDTAATTGFDEKCRAVRESFESLLPEKSGFEKN